MVDEDVIRPAAIVFVKGGRTADEGQSVLRSSVLCRPISDIVKRKRIRLPDCGRGMKGRIAPFPGPPFSGQATSRGLEA